MERIRRSENFPLFKSASKGDRRPPMLTDARRKIILDGLEKGLPLKKCAQLAGVTRANLYIWRKDGISGKSAFLKQFCEDIKTARAKCEEKHLAEITKHALGTLEPERKVKKTYAFVRFLDPDTGNVLRVEKRLMEKTVEKTKKTSNWRASAWLLERVFYKVYGANVFGSKDNEPLTPEEMARRMVQAAQEMRKSIPNDGVMGCNIHGQPPKCDKELGDEILDADFDE